MFQVCPAVTEPVLVDDGSGYFKEILEDDNDSGEGFKGEQEIVKDLASKIYSKGLNWK